MVDTREIQILLSFINDPENRAAIQQAFGELGGQGEAVDELNRRMGRLSDMADELRGNFEDARRQVELMSQAAERFTSIGTKLIGAGAAIAGPLVLSAKKYVDTVKDSESTSRAWLDSTKQLEDAQVRIGRVAAAQIVPYMQKAANIAEGLARYAEAHPGLIGKMLGLGAGLIASGTLSTLVGQGIKLVADIKFLSAATTFATSAVLIQDAANKMLAASGVMKTASFSNKIPGSAVGLAIGATAAAGATGFAMESTHTPGRQFVAPGLNMGAALTGMSSLPVLGGAFTFGQSIAQFWDQLQKGTMDSIPLIGQLAQAIRGAGDASRTAADSFAGLSLDDQDRAIKLYSQAQDQLASAAQKYQENVAGLDENFESDRAQVIEDYGQRRADLEEQYEAQRTQIVADYNRQRVQAEQDFSRRMAQAEEDFKRQQEQAAEEFARGEAEAYANYQQQRADVITSYNQQMEDLERAHQERLRQLAEDHQARMEDLVAARDALGIVAEERRYKREKADENRQYQEQRKEAQQRLRQTLADLDRQYQAEREKRLEEYRRQQQEQQQQYDIERQRAQEEFTIQQARAKEEFQARLQQLDEQHNTEMSKLDRQFQDEMQQMDQEHRKKLADLKRDYDEERQQIESDTQQQFQELLGIHQSGYDQMKTAAQDYADWLIEQAGRIDDANGGEPGRASGGYVGYGVYRMGEQGREFVLNTSTTQMAERFTGGRLTQSSVLGAMGGGDQFGNISIAFPNVSMTKAEFKRFLRDEFPGAFADALIKARGKVPL